MSNREEVTQERYEELLQDATYLQDEAEALKYVIDEVPYDQSPPGKQSIVEMLLMIDHAQLSYFRPIMEDAVNDPRPTHLENYEHYEESFELDEEKASDIQKVLNKIVKHRAGLVNVIKSTSLIDWESYVYKDGTEIKLYDFIQKMIRFERSKLKDIADLVMVFNQEKQKRKELERRSGSNVGQEE